MIVVPVVLDPWESPPKNPNDVCDIFTEKRAWYGAARRSFERWGVPEAVQLAVIYQESSFRAGVRPPRRKILWILPGPRLSSAYGYAQVLDVTWEDYTESTDRPGAKRHDFGDAVDFVGWYGTEIHRQTGIAKDDAYGLYLAYHEGPAGFSRGSHQAKPWLLEVARRVESRAQSYQRQYAGCQAHLARREVWRRVWMVLILFAGAGAAWGVWRWRRARRRQGNA